MSTKIRVGKWYSDGVLNHQYLAIWVRYNRDKSVHKFIFAYYLDLKYRQVLHMEPNNVSSMKPLKIKAVGYLSPDTDREYLEMKETLYSIKTN